jgi:SPOC domain
MWCALAVCLSVLLHALYELATSLQALLGAQGQNEGREGSRDSHVPPSQETWQHQPDREIVWRGSVMKSAIVQCCVRIVTASDVVRSCCSAWQDKLDVLHRTVIPPALQGWQEHHAERKGWAWLHPDFDDAAFAAFVEYLAVRDRAGIARPEIPGPLAHTVYLIPASQEISDAVGLRWEQSSGLLLLLLIHPKPIPKP